MNALICSLAPAIGFAITSAIVQVPVPQAPAASASTTTQAPCPKGAYFGCSMAVCSDLDGDGVPEIAILNRGNRKGDPSCVLICNGKTDEVIRALAVQVGQFGFDHRCTNIGDQDGDQSDDLMVATSGSDEVSRLEIWSPRDGRRIRVIEIPSEPDFAQRAQPIPDVDGDGARDVLTIVSKGYKIGVRMLMLSSKTGDILQTIALEAGDQPLQSMPAEPVSAVGDIDRDGRLDFAVGTGKWVKVFSGADGHVLLVLRPEKDEQDRIGNQFGSSVCGAVDLNADGCSDIVVSCVAKQHEQDSFVRAYSGKDGAELFTYHAPFTGITLGVLADLNADGVADLIVSERPRLPESIVVISGRDGTRIFNIADPMTGQALPCGIGWNFVSVPDMNGDHVPDFLTNRCNWKATCGDSVLLFCGADGKLIRQWRYETMKWPK